MLTRREGRSPEAGLALALGPAASSLGMYPGLSTGWRLWSVSRFVFGKSSCASVSPREAVSSAGNPRKPCERTHCLSSPDSPDFLASSDYVVQFEEDQFQPGVWHDHSTFPGSVNSAVLRLSPYVNYQFRVIAINEVGSSHPSLTSERYRTSGARECLRANGGC